MSTQTIHVVTQSAPPRQAPRGATALVDAGLWIWHQLLTGAARLSAKRAARRDAREGRDSILSLASSVQTHQPAFADELRGFAGRSRD